MTLVDAHLQGGSDLDKLWNLLVELSSQLSHNRQQTEELHRRAEELKVGTQAIHNQTGYTLRRFNLDVSRVEFDSELERQNVNLVNENQALHQENRALSILIKDYEATLENVMGKFRAHAAATQQHHLDLVRHYESLLLNSNPSSSAALDERGNSIAPGSPDSHPSSSGAIDPLHLNLSLAHVASLIRKAVRAMNGEDPESIDSPPLSPIDPSAASFFSAVTASESSSASSTSTSTSSELSSTSRISQARPCDVTEGGYIGKRATSEPHYLPTTSTSNLVQTPPLNAVDAQHKTLAGHALHRQEVLGPVDDALEKEIEVAALRKENRELRYALGIEEREQAREEEEGARGMLNP
ncbi:BQ2448_4549 [Microbotryum intermedium]|uniref:BQ2448_4549 protein n=1 Tax=Microbotryum intermedium TaxID=269621 RepID=A0A238FF79_9BASI|nr:BQ2448_4549 [Microbotryum intermedium]